MAPTLTARRTGLVAGATLATLVVALAIVIFTRSDGDSGGQSGTASPSGTGSAQTGQTGPGTVTGNDGVQRSTGAATCAFLSTDEIRQTTQASAVELRQSLGPTGNPGCEWVLGDERRVLQLEFQPGRGPTTLPPQGENVSGPWDGGKWVASSRTLYVVAKGQAFSIRATDNDEGRAKANAAAVAALAAVRL